MQPPGELDVPLAPAQVGFELASSWLALQSPPPSPLLQAASIKTTPPAGDRSTPPSPQGLA